MTDNHLYIIFIKESTIHIWLVHTWFLPLSPYFVCVCAYVHTSVFIFTFKNENWGEFYSNFLVLKTSGTCQFQLSMFFHQQGKLEITVFLLFFIIQVEYHYNILIDDILLNYEFLQNRGVIIYLFIYY